jgi:nucleoside-diphosphate-sugar epimerase
VARVLITGASGLIGRRVLEAYADTGAGGDGGDDRLITVDRATVDLLEPGAWRRVLDEQLPDVVVHLAWSASALPDYREHDDNARWSDATIAAAALAVDRGIHFVATGTSVDGAPADDAYSRAKAATRTALADRIAAGELTWLRPFYVFDEERPSPAVLRAALAAQASGDAVALSSPDALHDFVHARDVGAAIRTVVLARLTGAIDIGSGALSSVSELVESYGCRWMTRGTASAVAASDAAAEVAALRGAGWAPVATDARLGRDRNRDRDTVA